jgi:hypothetical protein
MRVDTLANLYFLNLYIPTKFLFFILFLFLFFFNFRVGTCPSWSYTGSASECKCRRWVLRETDVLTLERKRGTKRRGR